MIWVGLFVFNIPSVWAANKTILPKCVTSNETGYNSAAGPFSADCRSVNTFVELAINIGAFAFSIIGALALGALIYGGFLLVISNGTAEDIQKGWGAIFAAAAGLGITFSGYILVSFVIKALGGQSAFNLIK